MTMMIVIFAAGLVSSAPNDQAMPVSAPVIVSTPDERNVEPVIISVPAEHMANEPHGGTVSAVINAFPANNPADWVLTGDYPIEALQNAEEGKVNFQLEVAQDGKAGACEILRSSGSKILDAATCSIMTARGVFNPALDKNGEAIDGFWRSAVNWVLPDVADDFESDTDRINESR